MTITLTREEAQQVLDALDSDCNATRYGAIEDLRARLAQPEPEPVAVVDANDEGYWADILPDRNVKVGQLLYTASPQREWQGLTAYEIQELHLANPNWGNFACAIEAKLKEKNA